MSFAQFVKVIVNVLMAGFAAMYAILGTTKSVQIFQLQNRIVSNTEIGIVLTVCDCLALYCACILFQYVLWGLEFFLFSVQFVFVYCVMFISLFPL